MFKGFNLKYPEYEVITPQTKLSFTVRSLNVQEEERLIGKLDIEIEFNCDYPWHEPWVKDKIENNYIPALIAARDNINAYSI